MNAPAPRAIEQAAARSADANRRLAVASRLAAGMLANPNVYSQRSWQSQVAHDAMAIADRLIALAEEGGL
jgi:hypothetical protein